MRKSPSTASTSRNRPLQAGDLDNAFDEGTIRVPVRGEEVVAQKEAVVTGEVVINREQTRRPSDRLRHASAVKRWTSTRSYTRDRAAFQEHFGSAQRLGAKADTRTFEDASRTIVPDTAAATGAFAGLRGRQPDLRRSHTGGRVEELREEIREGWNGHAVAANGHDSHEARSRQHDG